MDEYDNFIRSNQIPRFFHLNMANNRLKNAPEIFHHFRSKVSKLNLNGNHVGKLNATTFERMNLFDLRLENTSLSVADLRPFEPFKHLIGLVISDNNLGNTNFSVP